MSANLDRQSWELIEAVFHEALEIPAPERSAYLERRDLAPEIKHQVRSLLASLDEGDEFLEHQSQSFSGVVQQAVQNLVVDLSRGVDGLPDPQKGGVWSATGNDLSVNGEAATGDSDRGLSDLLRKKRQRDEPQDLASWAAHVPGYELRHIISRGGMGTVFAAWDPQLLREVAIKVISGRQIDARVYRQFVRESATAAQLKSDHIVTIHAIGDEPEFPFLVMELIKGPSLKQWIAQNGAAAPKLAADWIHQAAQGLSHAHASQLIHRDVKPANLILEPQTNAANAWRVKLIDFGLARSLDRDQWESSDQLIAGTPAYMAPEQLTAPDHVDQRADVYGLGATLYHALTGIPPFQGPTVELLRRIQFENPVPPRRLNRSIPVDLNSICLKALAKEPHQRYRSAQEFADDLQRFQRGESTKARPISWPRQTYRWAVRHPRSAAINLALVLAVLGLIAGGLVAAQLLAGKNRQLAEERQSQWESQVKRIADANPGALPLALESVNLAQPEVETQLREILDNVVYDQQAKVNAAVALAGRPNPPTDYLLASTYLAFRTPWQCQNLISALRKISELEPNRWQQVATKIDQLSWDLTARQEAKARVAIVAAHCGAIELLQTICDATQIDPQPRTTLIHLLPEFHPSCVVLAEFLKNTSQPDVIYAYCCGLALTKPQEYSVLDRLEIQRALNWILANQRDAGVLAAARSALRQWSDVTANRQPMPIGGPLWVIRDDIGLVQIEPGRKNLGRLNPDILHEGYPPHEVTLTRSFYVSDREINWGQFKVFLQDDAVADRDKPEGWRESFASLLNTSDRDLLPATEVSWVDAILYCNWLSQQLGLQPAYELTGETWSLPGRTDPEALVEIPAWRWNRDANGIRLPTEAEWEFACRANAETDYHFGNDERLVPLYINVSNFRRKPLVPGGSLLPNRFGLYEMHGNVWEWCFDWYSAVESSPLVDPQGPAAFVPEMAGKVYRGGGVAQSSGDPGSGARGRALPNSRFGNLGFRIAR